MADKTQLLTLLGNGPGDTPNDFYGKLLPNIIPDTFPLAQNTPVSYAPLLPPDVGEYDTKAKNITVQSLAMLNAVKKAYGTTNTPLENTQDASAVSGVLTHEAAHAIWDKDLDSNTSYKDQYGQAPKAAWNMVHANNLADNKALGDYAYKNDPSHSFADAFSLYTVNPERLKNTFPDIYNYFAKLTGFEYSRGKKNK